MPFEDWDTNADGSVKIYPLVEYETFTAFGQLCGLRLHYAESEAELAAGRAMTLPLILTMAQARRMARVLADLADKAERQNVGETTQ